MSAVKVAFETDDVEGAAGFEQMWLGDVDFDGSTVSGVLLNNAHIDHPMAVHMAAALEEHLADDSSIDVNDFADDNGLSMLHQMVLGGSGTVVMVLLDHRVDATTLAPNGMTPAQLAQAAGWKNLVPLLDAASTS